MLIGVSRIKPNSGPCIAAIRVAFVVFALAQLSPAAPPAPVVVPVDQRIAGKTYAEWGVEWYRWDLGNPTNKAASLDPTGATSATGQSGPVWFLAGKSGPQDSITRNVVVPTGKHIFFPIINLINDYPCPDPTFHPGPNQTLEEFLSDFAKAVIDTTVDLSAELDGRAVENVVQYRARSSLFNFAADASWTAFDPCITGTQQQGVADGYWLMLEPLSAGPHTIKLRGKNFIPGTPPIPFGNQDVTLNLRVVDPDSLLVPVDGMVAGLTQSEWHAKWWQWALHIPDDGHHPLKDETGADAHRDQSGPVWFLGGVINSSGRATRKVVIPAGKHLYFPILNVECSTVEPPPFYGSNEAELRACATGFPKVNPACAIDGVAIADLSRFDLSSPLFDFVLPASNVLGVNGGGPGQAVDSGIYLMVQPLSPGSHTIRFTGGDATFSLDITYEITVPPEGIPFITRIDADAGQVRVTFWTPSGGTFQLESAPEVTGPWSDEGQEVTGDGEQHAASQPVTGARRFFRVRGE